MLGPIKGYTSLIQDGSKPGSNARWWADKIMRDVETLERELECSGMLTLEGPEAAPTSWRSVIERALSHVRILESNAQIEIHNEAQSEFVARGELISRALFQVLRNA